MRAKVVTSWFKVFWTFVGCSSGNSDEDTQSLLLGCKMQLSTRIHINLQQTSLVKILSTRKTMRATERISLQHLVGVRKVR